MGEFADQDASPDRLLDALQLFRNAAPSVPDDDSNASSESSELGHALAEFKEDDCESAGIDSEDSPVESCETLSSLCASDAQDAISVASSDVEESHAALDADHCEVSGKHGDQGHQARKTDRTIVVVVAVAVVVVVVVDFVSQILVRYVLVGSGRHLCIRRSPSANLLGPEGGDRWHGILPTARNPTSILTLYSRLTLASCEHRIVHPVVVLQACVAMARLTSR